MTDITEKLLQDPRAQIIADEIIEYLKEENKKRRQYFDEIDDSVKAEFINGEIVYHSPVNNSHNMVGTRLLTLLMHHVTLYKLGYVGFDKVSTQFTRNVYEPDICFFNLEKSKHFKKKQVVFPVPDFVVEILSDSTEANDRTLKYLDYEMHGVKEYWIIHPMQHFVEQYILNNKKYQLHKKYTEGTIENTVVPGFFVDTEILFDEDAFMLVVEHDKMHIVELKKELEAAYYNLAEKDNVIAEKDNVIAEKDNVIAEKDNVIAEKDSEIAEKDELIAKLQALLLRE